MKYFSLITATALALSIPAFADETTLEDVLSEACAVAEKYDYNGLTLGMTPKELETLGTEPLKENALGSGTTSVLLKDKTYIFWRTTDTSEDPVYTLSYEEGALDSFTEEEGEAFIQNLIELYGEPELKEEGKSFMDAGYPKARFGPQKDIKQEKYQPIRACLNEKTGLNNYTKRAIEQIDPRKFGEAWEMLQTNCPDLTDEYHDYMIYSLQPVINAYTSKVKFRLDMTCPAYEKFK